MKLRIENRKLRIELLLLAALVLFSAAVVHADTWQNAVAQISQDLTQSRKDVETAQQIVGDERSRLNRELSALRAEAAQDEKSLQTLKTQFEELLQTEEKLRKDIEAQEAETKTLAETLRTAAKDVKELVDSSLITPENASRHAHLAPLLKPERSPGMDDIENLTAILFEEMEGGKEIRKRTGTFINDEGAEVSGTLIRIGKFTSLYQTGDAVGYLRFDKSLQKLTAVPGKPPWHIRRNIEEYFSGKSDSVPLDLTGGIIAEQVNRKQKFREHLEAGGLLVWPILLIAAVALLMCAERLYTLGRIPANTDRIMENIRALFSEGDVKGCQAICEKHSKIPVCNIIKTGLDYVQFSRESLENALEEAVLRELPRLERFLSTLAVLAAVAPLLGLLGTVTGMIHTFQGITVFGTSDPRMMSGGISEALITTELGLSAAIPIIIAHHFFDRRVEKIIGDMEEKGTAFVTLVLKIEK